MFDNYLEKWHIVAAKQAAGTESVDGTEPVDGTATVDGTEPVENEEITEAEGEAEGGKNKKGKITRLPGKYTKKKAGACKYSGWSHAGMTQFNELHEMVKEDRACPQSEAMECELLAFCRKQAGVVGKEQHEQQDGMSVDSITLETAEAMMPVEAAWDSDDD